MDSGLTAVVFATTDKGVIPETSRLKPNFALLNKHFFDKRSTQSALLLSIFIYLFIYLRYLAGLMKIFFGLTIVGLGYEALYRTGLILTSKKKI